MAEANMVYKSAKELISHFYKIVAAEFSDADVSEGISSRNVPAIRVSWKLESDNIHRTNMRAQPVVIELHEDIFTSQLVQQPLSELDSSFVDFIRNQRSHFKPRRTESPYQEHIPERWMFPENC